MVDTKRTLTDLLTNLFQDGQVARSITAQRMRDLTVSVAPPHGSASMEANALATTINTILVFEKIAGVFIPSGDLTEIGISATNGVMTYTGIPDRHFHIVGNVSLTSASSNQVICLQWFKNDTTALPAPLEDKIGTGSDIRSLAVHADVSLATNDTLTLKVANSTSTGNLTVRDYYAFAMGMLM